MQKQNTPLTGKHFQQSSNLQEIFCTHPYKILGIHCVCIRKYNFLRLPELPVVLLLCNTEPAILTYGILYFLVMITTSRDFISFLCFSFYNNIIIFHYFSNRYHSSYSRKSEFVSRHDKLVSRLSA
jgi:hypothetical protein